MPQVRSLRLGNDDVLVEVDPSTPLPFSKRDSGVPEGAEAVGFEQRVEDAAMLIRRTLSSLAQTTFEAAKTTDARECSVEISLAFKGEVTPVPVVVKAGSEATIKVVMKWQR